MVLGKVRLAAVSTAAIAILSLAACGQSSAPAPKPEAQVGVVTLKAQDTTENTSLPGRVSAVESSEVRPQVDGVITRRLFEEGTMVQAGQVLYQIEDAPYRAALASAQGQLANAQATIRSTQLQADRYKSLLAIKGVSQQDYDNAVAAAQAARAQVQTAKAAVMSAQVNLGFTRIRAPISGRIGRSLVTVGGLAQTGQTQALALISKIGEVYVDVSQPASRMLDLQAAARSGGLSRASGAAARVQLVLPNGAIYPIEGSLEFSEATVDDSSGSVTIRARFPNPDGTLLPGMYVQAQLVDGVRHNAILAPQKGVTHDEKGDAVAMVLGADGKVQQRKIELGSAIGQNWVVTSGLKAGDRLIVDGLLGVKPGDSAVAQNVDAPGSGDMAAPADAASGAPAAAKD
ncbi:efflux RND transporter periplasmic adaptor subunit [Novosphingobium sp. 9]|uniref:efflux RND transporter periplasmic adaptor subunit n=1 Tax=Novosphingobium sp. 9 TaxID=2025349 RepID=UPI0021B509D5|nr:efflux RND transporter periplasmic adaptor subunit [Novosphingobium sp. 9]